MMKFEVTKPTTVKIEPPLRITLEFHYKPSDMVLSSIIVMYGYEYKVKDLCHKKYAGSCSIKPSEYCSVVLERIGRVGYP